MKGKWKNLTGYTIAALMLCSLLLHPSGASFDVPEGDLTIEIVFDEETLNLSLNPNAVTFSGWVNWTGYTLVPITLHLQACSDLGDVYLSQYDFTFQTPESYPFTGLITNGFEGNFTASFHMTISGTFEQGGVIQNINPITWLVPAYYWEEEENDIIDYENPQRSDDIPSLIALPFLPISLGAYLIVIRPRLRKNVKIKVLSDKN